MEMENEVIVLVIGVSMALIRVIELLIKKAVTPKNKSVLTPKEHSMLESLYEQHACKDNNGVPMWYMPRELSDDIKNIETLISQITISIAKLTYIQEERSRKG